MLGEFPTMFRPLREPGESLVFGWLREMGTVGKGAVVQETWQGLMRRQLGGNPSEGGASLTLPSSSRGDRS